MAPMTQRHPRVQDHHYENKANVRLSFRSDGRPPMENDPHRRALVKSYVEDGVRWVL